MSVLSLGTVKTNPVVALEGAIWQISLGPMAKVQTGLIRAPCLFYLGGGGKWCRSHWIIEIFFRYFGIFWFTLFLNQDMPKQDLSCFLCGPLLWHLTSRYMFFKSNSHSSAVDKGNNHKWIYLRSYTHLMLR